MILKAGHVIAGRYEIIEQIGSGGMAIVYRAKDMKLDRFVTVKVLREEHISNDEFRQRFQVEARSIASLNHSNIVNVYDVGTENSINYIVMEYIDGVTLKELISKRAPFSDEEVIGVSIQVAAALAHAHKNGVIHRDIKPQNILVTSNGTIKVTDFGIARSANSNTMSIGGSTMGSVHYISPEQAKGEAIDAKSDLYSIGILMYEMVTGVLPYDADTSVSIALMHINEQLPSIRRINPDISKNTEGIIYHLTEKEPDKRYQSAERLLADLKTALTVTSIMSYDEPSGADLLANVSEAEDDFDLDDLDNDDYYDNDVSPADKSLEKKVYLAGVLTAVALIIIISIIILPKIQRQSVNAMVKVPSLIGMSFEDATKALEDLGLEINKEVEGNSDIYELNTVINQNYAEGDEVKAGTTVNVAVSLGTSKLEIPDLTNKEISVISDMKIPFKIGQSTFEFSDTVTRNTVISQTPAAGEKHDTDTEILLVISKGPAPKMVSVSDVTGMTEADATAKLQSKGFEVRMAGTEASEKYAEGLVAFQTPVGGKEALEGTTVVLTLSSGKPVATPEPTVDPNPGASATPEIKTFYLPCDPYIEPGTESVIVTVFRKTENGMAQVYSQKHYTTEFPITVPVSDVGVVEYHMYVNGYEVSAGTVNFSDLPS